MNPIVVLEIIALALGCWVALFVTYEPEEREIQSRLELLWMRISEYAGPSAPAGLIFLQQDVAFTSDCLDHVGERNPARRENPETAATAQEHRDNPYRRPDPHCRQELHGSFCRTNPINVWMQKRAQYAQVYYGAAIGDDDASDVPIPNAPIDLLRSGCQCRSHRTSLSRSGSGIA